MKHLTTIFCLAIACAIVFAGCGNGDKPDKPDKGDADGGSQTVQSIEVAAGDGRVSEGSWLIDAPFDLIVDEIKVEAGQEVKQGDLVFVGKYDPERGGTAWFLADREEKAKKAQATYDKKAEQGRREMADMQEKIDAKSDELRDKDAELTELQVPMETAENDMKATKEAYDNFVDGMKPADPDGKLDPQEEEQQKSKWRQYENAQMLYEKARKNYDDVNYSVVRLRNDIANLEKMKSGIRQSLDDGSYASDEWAALQRAKADFADIAKRIEQTEFRALADSRVVVVNAKNGDKLSARTRIALLVDPARFEIKAQMFVMQADFVKKGAELEMLLQFGEETVACKAVVLDDPEPYDDEKKTVHLALADCDTRAQAEELMTKAEREMARIRVVLKITQ